MIVLRGWLELDQISRFGVNHDPDDDDRTRDDEQRADTGADALLPIIPVQSRAAHAVSDKILPREVIKLIRSAHATAFKQTDIAELDIR